MWQAQMCPLLALAGLLAITPLTAQQEAPTPTPWFLYVRDGGQSPLYLFASYSFGVPTIMLGAVVDTPNNYHESLAGAGVNLFAENGNGASALALVSDASDSWYFELYGLPNVTIKRLNVTGFAGVYLPLQQQGVRQYFLDPVTVLFRAHPKLAVGGSYTIYKIEGLLARQGAGPALQVAIPHGTATVDALAAIDRFVKELRVTLEFVF